jgi:hypothetical protein
MKYRDREGGKDLQRMMFCEPTEERFFPECLTWANADTQFFQDWNLGVLLICFIGMSIFLGR